MIAYDHAPGQQVAHRSFTLPMTDGAALAALIEREHPDLVIPEIEAIATPTLVELEEKRNVRVIPTARAAFLTIIVKGYAVSQPKRLGCLRRPIGLRVRSPSCTMPPRQWASRAW